MEATGVVDDRPWHQRIDKWFWGAVLAGLLLRIAIAVWPLQGMCVRDECSYKILASQIADGEGLQPHNGWLWSPLFPYLFGGFVAVFGHPTSLKVFQVPLSALTVAILGWLGSRLSPRTGRVAAWLAALHPTLAFFASTYWAETTYGFTLIAGLAATLKARGGDKRWAVGAGVLIGLTFLSRGIATLLPPLYLLVLLWPETETWRTAWARLRGSVGALVLALTLTVAPWSIHASTTHGGLILSDATVGQQFFFGNNRFEPITFDYGNGIYTDFAINNLRLRGRSQCDESMGLVEWNRCETANGLAFIRDHPQLFVERIPLRWAQLLNPHTFFTRHARWGRYVGLPWWLKEGVSLWVVATSFAMLWGGGVALWRRAKGPIGVFSAAIWIYYLAVIACFFGLSRFRLPVEPFLLLWLAHLIAEPGEDVPGWRKLGGWLTLAVVVPLTLWFLPHGFPGLR